MTRGLWVKKTQQHQTVKSSMKPMVLSLTSEFTAIMTLTWGVRWLLFKYTLYLMSPLWTSFCPFYTTGRIFSPCCNRPLKVSPLQAV